jgi:hypothetical protein
MHAGMHACTHACIHTYMHTCTPICMPTCRHTYTHTCMHTYIHHTCMHTNRTCIHTMCASHTRAALERHAGRRLGQRSREADGPCQSVVWRAPYRVRLFCFCLLTCCGCAGTAVRSCSEHAQACRGCNTPATSAAGLGSPLSTSAPVLSSLIHFHICAGTGLTHPLPHRRRDRAHSPLPHLRRDWAHPSALHAPSSWRLSADDRKAIANLRCACSTLLYPRVPSSTLEYPRVPSSTPGLLEGPCAPTTLHCRPNRCGDTFHRPHRLQTVPVATRLQRGCSPAQCVAMGSQPQGSSPLQPGRAVGTCRTCPVVYRARHGIPRGMVSRAAWHPLRHCWR